MANKKTKKQQIDIGTYVKGHIRQIVLCAVIIVVVIAAAVVIKAAVDKANGIVRPGQITQNDIIVKTEKGKYRKIGSFEVPEGLELNTDYYVPFSDKNVNFWEFEPASDGVKSIYVQGVNLDADAAYESALLTIKAGEELTGETEKGYAYKAVFSESAVDTEEDFTLRILTAICACGEKSVSVRVWSQSSDEDGLASLETCLSYAETIMNGVTAAE